MPAQVIFKRRLRSKVACLCCLAVLVVFFPPPCIIMFKHFYMAFCVLGFKRPSLLLLWLLVFVTFIIVYICTQFSLTDFKCIWLWLNPVGNPICWSSLCSFYSLWPKPLPQSLALKSRHWPPGPRGDHEPGPWAGSRIMQPAKYGHP